MSESEQNPCYLTIREASRLIETRQLSPVELTRAFLQRVKAVDSNLHCYVTVLGDKALTEARTAETEILRGRYRGPLHGIPIALKDLYNTQGTRTTAQSKVLEHHLPLEDATAIARLREAGAIILGKQTMSEFALGGPGTSPFGQARNPWNMDHLTGGSSSGSAAAVAAGLCMGSLGSDTGGSIRGPSSLCGIVGLKPTYGRVSRFGLVPLSWSLDHCGPMTRTVEDTALMLQAIAGYDPKDLTTSRLPVPDYSAALRENVQGLRIGVPRRSFSNPDAGVDSETLTVVDKALAALEELGARVEEVNLPSLEYAGIANLVIVLSEAFAYHQMNLRSQRENFGKIVRDRLYIGGLLTANDYVQAQRVRSRVTQEFADFFRHVDLLAMPTSPAPAPLYDEYDPVSQLFGAASFTEPFNLTGMPAISVPCGFSLSGLPIGLQIAGKPFDESIVLRAAYTYQQHARWYKQRPPI